MSKNSTHQKAATFPFKSRLNLSLLIRYWEANLESNAIFAGYPADRIKEMIADAPELREPIEDLNVLNKHQELLGFLMSVVFPPALVDQDISAALVPFLFQGVYATPGYQRLLPLDRELQDVVANIPKNDMNAGKVMHACTMILEKFYDTQIPIDKPILLTIKDDSTGLDRIYKLEIDDRFVEILAKKKPAPIEKGIIKFLMQHPYDTALWTKYIDTKNFEFQGFMIFRLVDVTVQEMLSSIKYDLLEKDAIIKEDPIDMIEEKVRAIFNLPNLKLGLAYFDPNNNVISNHAATVWNSLAVGDEEAKLSCEDFRGSIYELAFNDRKPMIIEDLREYDQKTTIENKFLDLGIRNIAVAPLLYDGEVLGCLELANPEEGKINAITANKLESVLPMFTTAVKRVIDELNTEARALIQQECTAIHPTVEWRFIDAAYQLLDKKRKGENAVLEEIVFPDVYPLYGLNDIRSSSVVRNAAIQEDLMENLEAVQEVINAILAYHKMPILDEINFRVKKEIDKTKHGITSGDESFIMQFIKSEVDPLFTHFANLDKSLAQIIENYRKKINNELGIVYHKRKDFEDSVTMINQRISEYLDKKEEEAQQMFPHYFEKYKTDGVEFNIYIGKSLVKDLPFDMVYLKNFRLWQLILMCEIAREVDKIKVNLPIALEITQLILVHGDPLSIKFRQDEKQFDVDGTYNIRYEIVKKRIDKALIKNSSERLTQPGKIAIVYTQSKEAEEYMGYIEYLKFKGYIKNSVEKLELENLQGANGLKALRIEINKELEPLETGNKLIQDVIESLNV